MRHEGDTLRARRYYFNGAPRNLKTLLRRRYEWMNRYIGADDTGVEVGCGTGLSREFIRAKSYSLSDVSDYEWLDFKRVDALCTPFDNESYDFIVCSNMIHHVAHPLVLLREMHRILKPGGRLIIQEVNGSVVMRILLRLMRHEGYSYEPDVFDQAVICNDPQDPWSANCVIPNLLFDDRARFERHVPGFCFIHAGFSECMSMINSGGVIAKTMCIPMPEWMLSVIYAADAALIWRFPQLFAMQRQVVLKKVGEWSQGQGKTRCATPHESVSSGESQSRRAA